MVDSEDEEDSEEFLLDEWKKWVQISTGESDYQSDENEDASDMLTD